MHISFDIFDDFGRVVSYVYFHALGPFFSSESCNTNSCSEFEDSLLFEEMGVVNDVTSEYDSCFPKSESIEAVRESIDTVDVKGHLEVVMHYYLLAFCLEM